MILDENNAIQAASDFGDSQDDVENDVAEDETSFGLCLIISICLLQCLVESLCVTLTDD